MGLGICSFKGRNDSLENNMKEVPVGTCRQRVTMLPGNGSPSQRSIQRRHSNLGKENLDRRLGINFLHPHREYPGLYVVESTFHLYLLCEESRCPRTPVAKFVKLSSAVKISRKRVEPPYSISCWFTEVSSFILTQ